MHFTYVIGDYSDIYIYHIYIHIDCTQTLTHIWHIYQVTSQQWPVKYCANDIVCYNKWLPDGDRWSYVLCDTAAMLHHLRHRGESATKTVKFFAAHTVNCVICNDHTIIDWMLLKFTQVIQQNCRQPGRKFEKSFCAVDRLSCQNPKPANSEAILFLIS